jgi:two-component system KDP operon response regulator KdpE
MPGEERTDRRTSPVILVVDDDDYVHSTLAAALRGLRPELVRAATAASGLEQALERRPDLAIVDLGLPDRDGYSLTRDMRARPELASLRICILTGYAPDEAMARDAGADAIIGKPFRLQEFLDTIRGQLGLDGPS